MESGIKIGLGFERRYAGGGFTDSIMTKEEMKNANPNLFTTGNMTVDPSDNSIYIYDENATSSEETGKFVKKEIPTKTSELTNDSNFQNEIQVQEKIDDAISGVTSFSYEVVDALPTEGEKGKIYLVENTSGEYDEYIWMEGTPGKFEKIGSVSDVNLENYYTKTETDTLLENLASKDYVNSKSPVIVNEGATFTNAGGNQKMQIRTNGPNSVIIKDTNGDGTTEYWSHEVSNKNYVDTELAKKQEELKSGTNIKTINSQTILGPGNINIEGGSGGFPKITLTNSTYSDSMGITYVGGEVDGITTEDDLVGKLFEMTIPNTKMVDTSEGERPVEFNTQREIILMSGGVKIGEYTISDMNGQTISPDWEHDTTVITQFITKTVTSGAERKSFGVLNLPNKGDIQNYSFNYSSTFDVSEIGDTITVATVQNFLRNYYGINELTVETSTGKSRRRGPQLYVANLSAFTEPDTTIFKRQTASFDMIITCSDGSYLKERKVLIKNNNYFINNGVVPVDGAYIDTGLYLKGNVDNYGFEGFAQPGKAAVIIGAFESQTARFTVRILGVSNKLQIMTPGNTEIISTEADMDFTKRFTCTINYNNGTPKVILLQDGKRFEKDLTGRNDTQSSRTAKFLIGNETATATYGNGVIYSARVNFRDIGAISVRPFMYEGEVVFADNEQNPSVNTIKRAVQGHFEVYNPNATV